MSDEVGSLSLTPGFQTGFRIRAVPRARLTLKPKGSSSLNEIQSWIELEGSCEFLPDEVPCRVTWLVKRGESGAVEEYSGYGCKLNVSGGRASAKLMIDAEALDLVGTGTVGVEVAPDFPYCEPSRVEPGPWGYDNKAHVTLSKTKGCKIGTVVTITPHTSGVYQGGALKIELSESDEGERGGGEAQIHELIWPEGDRKPRKWRIGCTTVEGPPTFDYREYGEAGTLEFGVTLFHGQAEAADESSVDPVWKRVWQNSKLVTGVPFPKLEAFAVSEGGFFFANSVSGKVSGFEPGLAVPFWIGAAVRKWGKGKAKWHPVGTALDAEGNFSVSFALPMGWDHVDDLYGMSCGAITGAEAFAGVIDYDTAVLSPAAGTIDEVPPRSAEKGSAAFVILGQPAAGVLTSSTGRKDLNNEVVAKAYTKKGGTYKWDGSGSGHGCPSTIKHCGSTVLQANSDGTTYCCGFTLWVALEVAKANGLLDGISAKELINLRTQWFGATDDAVIDKKQLAAGLKNFGLGKEIPFLRAKKGDFVQFWRTNGTGHSVVFLNWIKEKREIVGIRYRSSNSGSGIGDKEEKFSGHGGEVDPDASYAGRLMAKVTRPPQITAGDFRFFLKADTGKTFVQHAEIAVKAHFKSKIYAEVGKQEDDYAFAQITRYDGSYGLTTIYNGKDRPRPSPSEVSGSKLQVTAAVSGNEGSFVDVQGYDDSYLTHGAGQWTQKSGNLAELLEAYKTKKPSLFAKYFEDRGVELKGEEILVEGEAVGSKTSLQLAYCLWQSGYDTALQEIQIDVLAARIAEFYPSISGFKDLGKYYTSEQSIAHLLDLHVNRPAFVKNVAKKGLEAFLAANPTKKDPSKWSDADEAALVEEFLSIRHTYETTDFPHPMTDSKDRALAIKGTSELSTARNSYKP